MCEKPKTIRKLFDEICRLAHKHEVQHWKDAPGTDEQKLRQVLDLAREGVYLCKKLSEKMDRASR